MSKEIYLRAAALIASGKERFSCNAVMRAGGRGDEMTYYSEMMSPAEDRKIDVYDIEEEEEYTGIHKRECKNFRVLLLCMTAACCEDIE